MTDPPEDQLDRMDDGGNFIELAALVKAQGGHLARTVNVAEPVSVHPDLAVAAVMEGHDVHYYGIGGVVDPEADDDLALLAGDALYALGLELLAERGDLIAIRILADVIAHSAELHADSKTHGIEEAWQEVARQLDPAGRTSVRWNPYS